MHSIASRLIAAFVVLGALSLPAAASSVEEVLESYVAGLRDADVTTLEKVFFADGQFCRAGADEISCSTFADVLPSWTEKPDPNARGRVIARDIVGETMASVTYELEFGGDTYIDYLLLYRKQDRWLVVAKTTFIRP